MLKAMIPYIECLHIEIRDYTDFPLHCFWVFPALATTR